LRTFLYTAFALFAFALNSIFCRLALRGDEADAIGFTIVRLVSGAITLIVISYFAVRSRSLKGGSWTSAFFLFAYALCFSLAYIDLTAGTGALILFGSVQLSMIGVSNSRGEMTRPAEWVGLVIAFGGLIYLVFPGLASPPLSSSFLMAAAGAAWGLYTLRGKAGGAPLADTTGNFIRSVPMIAIAAVPFLSKIHLSYRGWMLAVLSGSVASGIGYAAWYAALKHHTATRAAVMQLSVPVIAACLGIALLGEAMSIRLAAASALILGGVGLAIFGRR
jgi:drug/metabolite transporter (DMT)-like permease